jgi:IS4 transposase
MTPWKHGPDKDKIKWEYLLDPTTTQVTVETLEVDATKHPDLAGINNGVVETTPEGTTTVKIARVALVDEYGAAGQRTLEELRAEAKDAEDDMKATTRDLEKTEQAYVAHRETSGTKDSKKPGYGRGKKREQFADDEDKTLYNACQDLHEKEQRLKARKESILASFVFFAISLFPGDDVIAAATAFIELARDYHARWLIENGFKVVKESFCRDIRSCKPTARQFVLVLGMMLHNWWRVVRVEQAVAWLRARRKPIVLWKDARPWIRLPVERDIPGLVDAVTFTTRVLTEGILSIIKETIKGVK